jgi:hypothetical protein
VPDIAARDAIPAIERYHMMKVAVQSDSNEYILNNAGDLTNTGWAVVVNVGISDAPIDGQQYARKDAAWDIVDSETTDDKDLTPAVTSGNGSTTTLTLTNTPTGYAGVYINGLLANLKGDKLGDCYFSADAGVTAKALGAAIATDVLFWNGVIATYELAATDRVDFIYN